ncbi:hypothetical protein ACQEUX_25705 [Micromonospora sp. CA-259024]|uniref:hypothetical protein n=1 Tax=Micromonospora sp. CA-259024 TaxID=3239965 RepID=UPI003D89F06D
MDTADDRLRSAVLGGVALVALAVGGWWWRAAAPAPVAAPVGRPMAEASVSTQLERVLADGAPDERVEMRVDSQTGEVVRMRDDARVTIDAATGTITDIDGDPRALFPAGDLPAFRETIWREQRELAPGQGVARQSTDDGSRYLLQYRCTRPGTLQVTVTGASIIGSPRIDCDGTIANVEVLPASGPIRVSLATVGDREIDVQAQLVALPR